MAWSEQQYPVPQNVPQGTPQNPLQPPVGAAAPAYYGVNPLQPTAPPTSPTGPANPMMQRAAGQVGVDQPAMAQRPQMAQPLNDDRVDVDDVEWVNRAKRVISGTQGDPHRQVQLIQHLRSQYLKQRFGRTVHTDEA
jgi:hypothetical protein